MIKKPLPTTKCPWCGNPTKYDESLLGKKPTVQGFHAYCEKCEASFSNAKKEKDRVTVWKNMKSNIYPSDPESIKRLKMIIKNSLNEGNRRTKEPSMCSENSEDALTWSVFSALERYGLLSKIYTYLTGVEVKDEPEIFYWGHNDKYPTHDIIIKYTAILKLAGEAVNWRGGYSEPDILLFHHRHGLINIEVKYRSPNDNKLRNNDNVWRRKRAEKMLSIGNKYVKKLEVSGWVWYELLRMWVPGCLMTENPNVPAFTLVNLLPARMLKKENGRVITDMENCLLQNTSHRFKQVTWEDCLQRLKADHIISDDGFWKYIERKFAVSTF